MRCPDVHVAANCRGVAAPASRPGADHGAGRRTEDVERHRPRRTPSAVQRTLATRPRLDLGRGAATRTTNPAPLVVCGDSATPAAAARRQFPSVAQARGRSPTQEQRSKREGDAGEPAFRRTTTGRRVLTSRTMRSAARHPPGADGIVAIQDQSADARRPRVEGAARQALSTGSGDAVQAGPGSPGSRRALRIAVGQQPDSSARAVPWA